MGWTFAKLQNIAQCLSGQGAEGGIRGQQSGTDLVLVWLKKYRTWSHSGSHVNLCSANHLTFKKKLNFLFWDTCRFTHSCLRIQIYLMYSLPHFSHWLLLTLDFSDGKESACNIRDLTLIPGLGRSPKEGNGYPLQYSCLGNSIDRRAWWATGHGVTKSQIWLSG